jgi:hypothetical protein
MKRIASYLLGLLALSFVASAASESTFSVGIHYLHHPENNGDNGPSEKNIPVWYPMDPSDGQKKPYTFGGAFPGGMRSHFRILSYKIYSTHILRDISRVFFRFHLPSNIVRCFIFLTASHCLIDFSCVI